jgi:hypothetical protein
MLQKQARTTRDLSPNLTFSPQEGEGTPPPPQELTQETSTGTMVKTKNPK